MKDRIRQIMESQHMSQQVFAEFIGTTPATLSGIFNDRTRPTINIVESIKKKIPDISTDWLLFGKGEMYQRSVDNANVVSSPAETASGPIRATESMIDFGQGTSTIPSSAPQKQPYYNSVGQTPQSFPREEIKFVDKPKRHVTEIRVYYDDQTWESFVPSKK